MLGLAGWGHAIDSHSNTDNPLNYVGVMFGGRVGYTFAGGTGRFYWGAQFAYRLGEDRTQTYFGSPSTSRAHQHIITTELGAEIGGRVAAVRLYGALGAGFFSSECTGCGYVPISALNVVGGAGLTVLFFADPIALGLDMLALADGGDRHGVSVSFTLGFRSF